MGHGITKCRNCMAVIAQCRCPHHDEVTWNICLECQRESITIDEWEREVTKGLEMLRIKVEVVPYGEEEHKCTIDTLYIANEGMIEAGEYIYGVYRYDPRYLNNSAKKKYRLADIRHMRSEGAQKLIFLCLGKLLRKRGE